MFKLQQTMSSYHIYSSSPWALFNTSIKPKEVYHSFYVVWLSEINTDLVRRQLSCAIIQYLPLSKQAYIITTAKLVIGSFVNSCISRVNGKNCDICFFVQYSIEPLKVSLFELCIVNKNTVFLNLYNRKHVQSPQ